ncbi:hydroxyacylglutathione hydrolase [Shewanella aquimarina]|uniref:hydroxyacylglutathione hydrolase n=1 Tax=Shewanella aquimarina TaxID=260365 RepID=UPI0020148544|nr:hydroxyacylglutathione hydrolase [Shewanella aquimarina]MCL2909296.1 hydroxyacylglutathione hydrolase [Shewanella aquimarina]
MHTVTPIPAFNDNYIWLIHAKESRGYYVVDPGDACAVLDYLQRHQIVLDGILITHHHSDHTGGIAELQAQHDHKLTVYGPDNENIKGINHPISGQTRAVKPEKLDSEAKIFHLPGHTLGHIAYLIDNHLFCGDTLFSAGCGRLFEGTPAQMRQSLLTLAQLDDDTLVYPAHEYTQANLAFALTVEDDNEALIAHANMVKQLRERNEPSLPTSIAVEKQINPFLRPEQPSIKQNLSRHFAQDVTDNDTSFTLLRQWKDNF